MPGMAQMLNSGWLGSPHTSIATPTIKPIHTDILSSDPPDERVPNPYPTITMFLRVLDDRQPQRSLSRYIPTFASADFYNIDDLVLFEVKELTGTDFNLTAGNATFLLKEVRNEMKRVDKAHGKRRRVS